MKTRPGLTLIIVLLWAAGCSSKTEAPGATPQATASSVAIAPASVVSDLYSDGIAKLIKTANYRFEVKNIQQSINAIEVAIRKYNAFISSSDLRLNNPVLEGKMTIRVQHEYFQELLKEIDQQAIFMNVRDIKTEDVSKQFVDLESRLKSKREVEQRYMEILRKKAGTIEELLKAEKQIGELHEEIEATISRINYLRDEVRYSTVNLELYQRVEPVIAENEATTLSDMEAALASGWHGLIAVFTGILYLWPLVILLALGSLLYRAGRKRQRLAKGF